MNNKSINHIKKKMMKIKLVLVSAIILLSLNTIAQNKNHRFAVELNGGISLATNKLVDTKLSPGGGFEAVLHYRVLKHIGIYGGWGWNKLPADNSFAGNDVCFEETGYLLGLEYVHSIAKSKISYMLRAGGLYNHIETENAEGEIINDTGHGLGYQLAGGFDIPIGTSWSIAPMIKYNSLKREGNFGETVNTLDYNYISVRIGIIKKF